MHHALDQPLRHRLKGRRGNGFIDGVSTAAVIEIEVGGRNDFFSPVGFEAVPEMPPARRRRPPRIEPTADLRR
ncbi:MAG: hypothetical protein R3F11_28235 [Verrucomicrobiales bacterium]